MSLPILSHSHLALAVYPSCIMWLVAIALPRLVPALARSPRTQSALWWLTLTLSLACLVPSISLTGEVYQLLPIFAAMMGILQVLFGKGGDSATARRSMVAVEIAVLIAACGFIAAPAPFLPWSHVATSAMIIMAAAVFALITLHGITPLLAGLGLALALGGAAIAYGHGAVMAAIVMAIAINALVADLAQLAFDASGARHRLASKARWVLAYLPALLAVEYLVFGY